MIKYFMSAWAILFMSYTASAQNVIVTEGQFFCKVEQFSARDAKSKKLVKKCASLIDSEEKPIKGGQACKDRALEKGNECLEISKADRIQVKVRLTEKVGLSANINTYTCELDSSGGSACP